MMDTNEEFDVGGGGTSVSPDTLDQLHKAMGEAIELEIAKAQMEDDLKALGKSLTAIKTQRIPDLMAQLQMDSCVHKGWKIAIADFVSGSLPSEEGPRALAIRWLEQNDGAGLIKTKLALEFGRSQHNDAVVLAQQLERDGYAPKLDSGVHSATLQAFARERLRNGDPIDTDVLGLYTGKTAKFTAPKGER